MDKFGHQISANTTNYPHTNVFSEAVRSLVNMMDQKFCRGQARNNPKSFNPKSCSIDSASPPRSFAARWLGLVQILVRKLVILRNRNTPPTQILTDSTHCEQHFPEVSARSDHYFQSYEGFKIHENTAPSQSYYHCLHMILRAKNTGLHYTLRKTW